MIFIFAEDASLDVVADVEAARRKCEGLDVESGVYAFYDADGRQLEAVFRVPNRRRSLFGGLIRWGDSGVFDLVAHPQARLSPIAGELADVVLLEPNPYFDSLEAVHAHLVRIGAI